MKGRDLDGIAGLRERRKNPRTGHLVGLYDGAAAGMDTDDGKEPWSTVCEAHGHVVAHETLEQARKWLADPLGWCEDCAREARGEKPEFEPPKPEDAPEPERVVAILDRPGPTLLAMCPVAARCRDGKTRVLGLAGQPPTEIGQDHLDDLVQRGDAARVDMPAPGGCDLVAGWAGESFIHAANEYGLPDPPFLDGARLDGGRVRLAPSRVIHSETEKWWASGVDAVFAALAAREAERANRAAHLALTTRPERPESWAAMWAATQEAGRAKLVGIIARFETDAGRRTTPARLEKRIRGIVEKRLGGG